METFESVVIDKIGFHARPASKIASIASKFKSDIKIISGGKQGNLKSIMNIMALGIKHSAIFQLEIEGEDEKEAKEAIVQAMIDNELIYKI
ncbi:HPr family phosphocarrier protein [Mesomycoplasma hyorhinis]|uniref:HPr family phosphocarrier protein n=2 Tax=Mesomycoplasma hyorhinis TaxID=2100 RepID=A0AAJ5NL87_MESHY|nr:HPr family phosphocarrier protein [Mesomycoplasma hyorhinis]AEC46082.1 hypothetical protein SRH_02665 [Mesomycoplasma hyorhinis MCLD]AEX14382.1 PTS system phosphocarrier protein [Mesomycoplasma hyorhinis GDL-1]AHA41410.1 PTS system phosphocarrier, HPr family protein [Mesomycoplasma hyorhinis DBS 1050]TRM74067.1 HPr family phosphocarrier protein [Sulfolobus sp. A20-N-F8]TRM84057.1 HPr family phosphocarrier protein [Sulfolobus sp. A20-N-F6]